MLVINYNGGKPTSDYYKYSVQGNNNADVIRFLISLSQGGLVFNEDYHYYAKVQCVDDDYYDKVRLTDVEFDDINNLIKANFTLKAQHTSHKQIEVSLSCENLDEEIVWQTQIVKITIANGVDSDSQIEDQYPSVLQDLQEQIDELKGGGGSGGSFKMIIMELQPSMKGYNNQVAFRGMLRLVFHNFTEDDIGSYIHLYRYSMTRHPTNPISGQVFRPTRAMKFRHPANHDSTETNIQKLGYVHLVGSRVPSDRDFYWADVPWFMAHGGAVQTEYEITAQHIAQGYMDIDIGREFTSLLRPNTNDYNNKDFDNMEMTFNSSVRTCGQTQFITYCQVKNDKVVCYSKNVLMACGTGQTYELIQYDDDGISRLTNRFAIKLLG